MTWSNYNQSSQCLLLATLAFFTGWSVHPSLQSKVLLTYLDIYLEYLCKVSLTSLKYVLQCIMYYFVILRWPNNYNVPLYVLFLQIGVHSRVMTYWSI